MLTICICFVSVIVFDDSFTIQQLIVPDQRYFEANYIDDYAKWNGNVTNCFIKTAGVLPRVTVKVVTL